jgi:SAM-dependent methyltransferase
MLKRIVTWRKGKLGDIDVRLHELRKKVEPGYRHYYEDFQGYLEQPQMGSRWVDLGCGTNIFVDLYRRNFGYGVGCDADLRLLERAARPLIMGNVSRLPFKNNSLDLVTMYMVVEHVPDPPAILNEIKRTLKPGGRLVCCTVHKNFWGSRLGRLSGGGIKKLLLGMIFGQPEEDIFKTWYRFNSPHDMAAGLRATGYRLTAIKTYCGYYHFSRLFFWLQYLAHRYTPLGMWPLMVSNVLMEAEKI